jgi:hypothetical protein
MFLYRASVPLLALSYAIRVVLFLALRPQDKMEWATTAAAATTCAFFVVLAYWLNVLSITLRPTIYPPLVIAAVLAMSGSVAFTIVAVESWLERRHS